MAHWHPSTFTTAATRQIWSLEKGAERSHHKHNNIKGSPGIADRETSTCSICHSPVLSFPFSSPWLSYLNEEKNTEHPLQLSKEEIEDAVLWDELLEQAHQGISMNRLVLQNPTRMGFSDSCPLGLGGFTHDGRGWQMKLNPALVVHGKDTLNNFWNSWAWQLRYGCLSSNAKSWD